MCECQKEIALLKERIKVLENARSYVGTVLQDSFCNGYFSRSFDLEGAEVIKDNGLTITVATPNGFQVYTTTFDSFEEKHERMKSWTLEGLID